MNDWQPGDWNDSLENCEEEQKLFIGIPARKYEPLAYRKLMCVS